MRVTTGLCGLLLLAAGANAAAAEMYKWKDAHGVTHYSERPPTGQHYEARHIDERGGVGSPTAEDAAPAESAQCASARQNLKVLAGRNAVMQDTDGDGKGDAALDESQREGQRGLAEAAVRAYCPPAAD